MWLFLTVAADRWAKCALKLRELVNSLSLSPGITWTILAHTYEPTKIVSVWMGLIKTKPRKTQRFLTQITNSLTGDCPVTAAMLGKCILSMPSQASLLLLLLLEVCSISPNPKSSTFTFINLALHMTKLITHCIVPETVWIVDKRCATDSFSL